MKILQICPPHLTDVATLPWENQKVTFNSIIYTYVSYYLRYLQNENTECNSKLREYTKPNYSSIVSNTHRKIARVCGSARLVLVELLDMTNVGAIVFRRRRAQTKNWTIFHTITATICKYVFSLLCRLSTRRCPHLLSASLWLSVAAADNT